MRRPLPPGRFRSRTAQAGFRRRRFPRRLRPIFPPTHSTCDSCWFPKPLPSRRDPRLPRPAPPSGHQSLRQRRRCPREVQSCRPSVRIGCQRVGRVRAFGRASSNRPLRRAWDEPPAGNLLRRNRPMPTKALCNPPGKSIVEVDRHRHRQVSKRTSHRPRARLLPPRRFPEPLRSFPTFLERTTPDRSSHRIVDRNLSPRSVAI